VPRDRKNRDHYDRPSWSERDKNRGKRRDSAPATPRPGSEPNRFQQKKMDEKFDSLFTDPKKDAARKKIVENYGKDGFVAAIDEYRAEYGLPDDFELLQQIFDAHKDAAVRAETLEKMDALVDATADSTKQVFKSRIKLLKMTAREPEVKKLAVRIAKARGY